MSLNTYNKNVDMIWHYCIISQIKLHGFWKRSKGSHDFRFIAKLVIPLNYRLHRRWRFNERALYIHCQWFSPGTPASSTTKTGCHDMAEILLKMALNIKSNQSNQISIYLNIPIECTLFCNLQSRAWTHAVLVIGLYELLGNPTT
jgi:hypothetical protein